MKSENVIAAYRNRAAVVLCVKHARAPATSAEYSAIAAKWLIPTKLPFTATRLPPYAPRRHAASWMRESCSASHRNFVCIKDAQQIHDPGRRDQPRAVISGRA